jgi:hypothetical protein
MVMRSVLLGWLEWYVSSASPFRNTELEARDRCVPASMVAKKFCGGFGDAEGYAENFPLQANTEYVTLIAGCRDSVSSSYVQGPLVADSCVSDVVHAHEDIRSCMLFASIIRPRMHMRSFDTGTIPIMMVRSVAHWWGAYSFHLHANVRKRVTDGRQPNRSSHLNSIRQLR